LTNKTIEELFAEKQEQMERIWDIVKTWDYQTYRTAQMMFAPIEDEDEDE
jgi:hypothetical protein